MKKIILSLLLVSALLLGGCGLKPVESAPVLEPEEVNNENLYSFKLENATGQDIYAIAFRESTVSEDYTENLLSPGFILYDGDWMNLSYDSTAAKEAFEALEDEGEGAALTSEYRMLLVMEDGRQYELSAFPLGDMEGCTLLMAEGVVYLSYSSLYTGQLISTKEAELAIYEQWGRQARDISALVSQLPAAVIPTEVPESPAPTELPETDEADGESDPNEGCLTGGLFY